MGAVKAQAPVSVLACFTLGPLLAACSGDDVQTSECALDGRDYEVPAEEVEHSCSHRTEGPYGEVADGEEVVNLHMLYTLRLTETDDGRFVGRYTFTARETTTHVFYVFAGAALGFEDASGEALCVAATIAEADCDGLDRIELVDLEEGTPIELVVGPHDAAEVDLVVERK
jgi:hypothetical protein